MSQQRKQKVMTSGWGRLCSNGIPFLVNCGQPDVLQGIDSDTTAACPVDAVVHPAKEREQQRWLRVATLIISLESAATGPKRLAERYLQQVL